MKYDAVMTPEDQIMKTKNSLEIILLLSLFYLLSACSKDDIPKDTQVPDKKVKEILSNYFQERFSGLDCVGNNQTFRYIPIGTSSIPRVEPKKNVEI